MLIAGGRTGCSHHSVGKKAHFKALF